MKKTKNVHAIVDGFIKDRVIGEDDRVAALVLVGALQAGATKKAVRSVTGLSYAAMAESFDRFVANRIFVNGKVAIEHIGHDHADDLVGDARTADETKPSGPFVIDARFPKLISGDDDDGRAVRDVTTGKVVGSLARKIEWQDIGHASARYTAKVTGYVVTDFWADGDGETTYATLAEAMRAVRAAWPGLTVAKASA